MKPLPTDSMERHSRFMAAFCDDLIAGDYSAPRAKAVCEISRQMGDLATPTGAGQPPARAAARFGDPVTIAYRKEGNRD